MTRNELAPQIDNILLTNLVGAISAENHRLLVHAIVDWALGPEDLKSTITGNSTTAPFSQAGAYVLDQNLRQYVAQAVSDVKSQILGGVGPAFDTLLELSQSIINDDATLAAFMQRLTALEATAYVKADGSTPFTAAQVGVPAIASVHLATLGQLEAGGPVFAVAQPVTVVTAGNPIAMGTTRATEAGQPAKVFVPTEAFASLRTKAAGTLVTAGILTIGTNAPTYDNIATVPLANALTIGLNVQQVLNSVSIAPSTTIYCKVGTVQVGTSATSYDVFLRGFYHVLPS